ncbi:tRNA preQ1(34) S-adenosylmethionine ribosyltransferase-isomerase QueA [Candidatus Pyrohabitans sp.]
MRLSDFDYHLPKELIAQEPLRERDASRLMVLRGDEIEHRIFRELARYLEKGDLLVFNNSRVIPARLKGRKSTGGRVELLLVRELGKNLWECLFKGRLRAGAEISFPSGISARVEQKGEGRLLVRFSGGDIRQAIWRIGEMPTPPYIKRRVDNPEEYQTVYASREGSIAAPTAGFHFTRELLTELRSLGVELAFITLHVGLGTFQPVKVEEVERHRMHEEHFDIPGEEAEKINSALEEGRRIFAVGTTTVRALESAFADGRVAPGVSATELFIYPGYEFKLPYSGLITNFHLPCSTLLMLVSAFAGRERIMRAYTEAVRRRYRFYSFGDAMLIFR